MPAALPGINTKMVQPAPAFQFDHSRTWLIVLTAGRRERRLLLDIKAISGYLKEKAETQKLEATTRHEVRLLMFYGLHSPFCSDRIILVETSENGHASFTRFHKKPKRSRLTPEHQIASNRYNKRFFACSAAWWLWKLCLLCWSVRDLRRPHR